MIANLIAIILLFFFPIESNHLYSNRQLPKGYEPKELVEISERANYLTTTHYVDSRIADKLEQLIMDAEDDGMCLTVIGAYRSYEYQQELYDRFIGTKPVAKAGRSEHQTGLAIDFEACPMTDGIRDDTAERLELRNDFNTLLEYQWLQNNAKEYGIEQSYREDNIKQSGYPSEPWHWKFMLKKL